MRLLDEAAVDAALDDLALIDRLAATFRAGVEMPARHHHTIAAPTGPGSADALLLLMPAWTTPPRERGQAAGRIGVKIVTVFPDNGLKSLPAICGQYLLLDGATGAAAGAAGWRHADQAAHGLRLGAGLATSCRGPTAGGC